MLGKLLEKIMHYFQVKMDVIKLTVIQRIAVVMGFCMLLILSMFLLLGIILFLGMGLAEYFGELVDSTAAGYFIVTGIYLVFLGILSIFKKHFQRWFAGLFISLLTANDEDDDDADSNSKISKS